MGNIEPLHPVEEPPDIENFHEWELGDEVQAAIEAMGITKPTPIQALAIGPVLERRDVIAKAETGTGKTLAFGAPMMSMIDPARRSVLGLVLSPTRELSEQVHAVLKVLGEARGVKTCLIVGGEPMQPQVKALQGGAQIVVGTPGRVMDLMQQGFLSFPWTEFVVLDEADKMLEIGFLEDIEKILGQVNEYRNLLLFSATFPVPLLQLARGQSNNPVEIATAKGLSTVDTITQYRMLVDEEERPRALQDLVRASGRDDVFLVFCDRRTDVDKLLRRMEREHYMVKALHGGYDQAARVRVMNAYRTGDVKVLIATDVASRGLDVNHVTFVINLGVPREAADYTHRIGRTGRAGRQGNAITFVPPRDIRKWDELERATGFDVTLLRNPRDVYNQPPKPKAEDAPKEVSTEEAPKEERPRKRERSSEGGVEERPRRERSERSDGEERPRRERTKRAEGEERPRRERGERTREERPRSDREERPKPEREERPRRERSEKPREEREERPRREQSEKPREERPRRERSEKPREEREERPRRERSEKPREEREERPRRERSEKPHEERAPKTSEQGGFGIGLEESTPSRPESGGRDGGRQRGDRKERPQRDGGSESPSSKGASSEARPKKESGPAPTDSKNSSDDLGGFGAGL